MRSTEPMSRPSSPMQVATRTLYLPALKSAMMASCSICCGRCRASRPRGQASVCRRRQGRPFAGRHTFRPFSPDWPIKATGRRKGSCFSSRLCRGKRSAAAGISAGARNQRMAKRAHDNLLRHCTVRAKDHDARRVRVKVAPAVFWLAGRKVLQEQPAQSEQLGVRWEGAVYLAQLLNLA